MCFLACFKFKDLCLYYQRFFTSNPSSSSFLLQLLVTVSFIYFIFFKVCIYFIILGKKTDLPKAYVVFNIICMYNYIFLR